MDAAQKQIIESIQSASNILVAVSTDPSVDGLSAALGLTLLLDKMDKRATAIFSGAVPPAINFLEPDKTFEDSADSLRDFIIALDKEKADHLRYKVDGDVVKIFITPYKTTLSQDDLKFSQGDYNVELVVALGVKDQDHLDKSLDAHGKILHDAKVVTITAGADASNLGSADWHDNDASGLSEMVEVLAEQLGGNEKLLDEQTATALLTGIVSATDRFSNNRTSSRVMTMAAQLMAAGANQQLIAAKLEEGHDIAPAPSTDKPQESSESTGNGDETELTIQRKDKSKTEEKVVEPLQPPSKPESEPETPGGEDSGQAELEKQLADLTQPNGTLADIEQQLQDTTGGDTPAPAAEPPTAPTDPAMPGFEPTEVNAPSPDPAPTPAPDASSPTPETPAEPPAIIQEHGPISAAEETPPINGIQADQDEEKPIDLYDVPSETPHEGTSVAPDASGGTAEGAAALAASSPPEPSASQEPAIAPAPMPEPVVEPTTPPVIPTTPSMGLEVPELPPLPPLPPLPSDANIPPLPPPPPVPNFGGQNGAMPSGAVSGDVFGDGGGTTPPSTEPPASTEPGMFKIPGQN